MWVELRLTPAWPGPQPNPLSGAGAPCRPSFERPYDAVMAGESEHRVGITGAHKYTMGSVCSFCDIASISGAAQPILVRKGLSQPSVAPRMPLRAYGSTPQRLGLSASPRLWPLDTPTRHEQAPATTIGIRLRGVWHRQCCPRGFGEVASARAVGGSGIFWIDLLIRRPPLRSLRVEGLPSGHIDVGDDYRLRARA